VLKQAFSKRNTKVYNQLIFSTNRVITISSTGNFSHTVSMEILVVLASYKSHDELLENKGAYYELYMSQYM